LETNFYDPPSTAVGNIFYPILSSPMKRLSRWNSYIKFGYGSYVNPPKGTSNGQLWGFALKRYQREIYQPFIILSYTESSLALDDTFEDSEDETIAVEKVSPLVQMLRSVYESTTLDEDLADEGQRRRGQ
jgi:hypothetical protein